MPLAALIDVDGTWTVQELSGEMDGIDNLVSGGLPGRHRSEQVLLGPWGTACINAQGHILPLAVNVLATRLVHALTGSFFLEQLRGPVVLIGTAVDGTFTDVPLDTLLRVVESVGPALVTGTAQS